MRIIDIKEQSIKLNLSLSNSMFSFKEMTTSIVKVDIDDGKDIHTGYAFNSTGRYACGAQMRNRFIPRLLTVKVPEDVKICVLKFPQVSVALPPEEHIKVAPVTLEVESCMSCQPFVPST